MKRILCYIIVIGVGLLLCCCSNANSQNDWTEDISSEQETSQFIDNIQEFDKATEESEIDHIILAEEYLARIVYVSNEWLPGQYVVVGINMEGNRCCGILNDEGEFKEIEGYTVIYPLADGKLLATEEPEAPITFDIDGYEELTLDKASVTGKIIDGEGNIVFEDEESFLRMIPVNSQSIMIFKVKGSLEGIEIQWGVLNQNGEWLVPLGNGMLTAYLQDKVCIESDGVSWNFKESVYVGASTCKNYVYFGIELDDRESGILQFTTVTAPQYGQTSYVYNARTEQVIQIPICHPIAEIAHNLLSAYNEFYDVNGGTMSLTLEGKVLESMDYIYMTYEGSICKEGKWVPYFSNKLDENHDLFTLSGERIAFDSQVIKYFSAFQGFYEDKIAILLKGEDKGTYLTVTNFTGAKILEPFRLTNITYDNDGLCGKYYFYISVDGCVCAVDIESGNIITSVESEKYSYMDMVSIKQISEDKFTVCWENDYDDLFYEIYQIQNGILDRVFG